ncbi:MAG: hypothetical protein WB800_44185 [Streptosporangiaceae bacterium]
MFGVAVLIGAGSGLGAVAFRYLIYFFTGWQPDTRAGHQEVRGPGVVKCLARLDAVAS